MALKKQILDRVVELGGKHGDPDLDLDEAMRAIKMPPLVRKEDVEEPDDEIENEQRDRARDLLLSPDTTDEEFCEFLEGYVSSVVFIRTFDDSYIRPFVPGTEWFGIGASEEYFRTIVKGDRMEFVEFAYVDGGCPDLYHYCLGDPDPADPTIYATDHEVSWQEGEIDHMGRLSQMLDGLVTLREATRGLLERTS